MYAVLIPAFNPSEHLIEIVRGLERAAQRQIVVVDDGSSGESAPIFEQIVRVGGVVLLRHPRNMGKGQAIKTGLNHLLATGPDPAGVVTMDADGQHTIPDLLQVGLMLERNDRALILGSRTGPAGVPLRSRLGNGLTAFLFGVITGLKLRDTQTGLRGIPPIHIPGIAALEGSRFEYEMQMLFFCAWQGIPIVEVPVERVYLGRNESSHFKPFKDSVIIYRILLVNWVRILRRKALGTAR